jgi:tetratricopeptide (TPR) repeat protein
MMKRYWLVSLMLISTQVWAILPFPATPAEQAMCNARIYSRLDRSNPNAMHMHHYCDGLRFIDRAFASMRNKREMQYYLERSIAGFDYVLRATQESFSMRGEVHVGKARALKLMGRKAEAVVEFHNALRYKFDSPDVFQALADHYRDTGDRQKALEIATEGLKLNPNSKGLKRRYTEFGGKLPYPEAADKTMPAEVSKDEINPEVKPEAVTGELSGQAKDADEPTAPTEQTLAAEPTKIGTPTNPYCRFCPD